jgi:hypothetical protein
VDELEDFRTDRFFTDFRIERFFAGLLFDRAVFFFMSR